MRWILFHALQRFTHGLVELYGPAMVAYAGRERSGVVEATMVRVKGTVPH